jgi:hypothetical protein
MTLRSDYAELLAEKGVSLSERFGIADIALRREDALSAADMLLRAGRVILGGDVYFKSGAELSLAYAFWSTDRDDAELFEDYVARAHAQAISYITKFPESTGHEALFSLVSPSR